MHDDSDFLCSMPVADPTAHHILLTGATGFLGQRVLCELLNREDESIIVCLVRPESKYKINATSDRVLVTTQVPSNYKFHQVIHLAACVDQIQSFESLHGTNVQFTKDLLSLELAPMLFCSTSSTQSGTAPFSDGYAQSKYVSEQLVLKCGGDCVWPPFLLWGNTKDWLTRLMQHCLDTGTYPAQLAFLPSARVDTCAKEIVAGGPCTVLDLDLHDLLTRILFAIQPRRMVPVSLGLFRATASRDPSCALYPIIPLLAGSQVGQPRSTHLDLLPLTSQDIEDLLRSLSH